MKDIQRVCWEKTKAETRVEENKFPTSVLLTDLDFWYHLPFSTPSLSSPSPFLSSPSLLSHFQHLPYSLKENLYLSWTFHLNESGCFCNSRPEEDHSVDWKYLSEYVLININVSMVMKSGEASLVFQNIKFTFSISNVHFVMLMPFQLPASYSQFNS